MLPIPAQHSPSAAGAVILNIEMWDFVALSGLHCSFSALVKICSIVSGIKKPNEQ